MVQHLHDSGSVTRVLLQRLAEEEGGRGKRGSAERGHCSLGAGGCQGMLAVTPPLSGAPSLSSPHVFYLAYEGLG